MAHINIGFQTRFFVLRFFCAPIFLRKQARQRSAKLSLTRAKESAFGDGYLGHHQGRSHFANFSEKGCQELFY
jgi:hypothetical protein